MSTVKTILLQYDDGTSQTFVPAPAPAPTMKVLTNPDAPEWSAIHMLSVPPTVIENVAYANKAHTFGAFVTGAGHTLRNIEGRGEGVAVQFENSSGCTLAGFKYRDVPTSNTDPLYVNDLNTNLTLLGLDIEMVKGGQHCIRIDSRNAARVATNVTIGTQDTTQPRIRLSNTTPYGGSPFNLRACNGLKGQRGDLFGHAPGFGALTDKTTQNGVTVDDPTFFAMFCDNVTLVDCNATTDQVIQFQAGVRNFSWSNSTIKSSAMEVFSFHGKYHDRVSQNIQFIGLTITGPGVLVSPDSDKSCFKFINCMFNGKAV